MLATEQDGARASRGWPPANNSCEYLLGSSTASQRATAVPSFIRRHCIKTQAFVDPTHVQSAIQPLSTHLDIPYVVSVALKYTSCVVDDAATGAAGVHLQALEGVLAQAETALFPAAGRMHAGLLYILRHARRRLA